MSKGLRLTTIWDRTAACLRNEAHILLPVAAAFFFLPSLLLSRFMPMPSLMVFDPAMVLPVVVILLFQTVGQLAILVLVLNGRHPTVRDAMGLALQRLLPAVGVQLLVFAILCFVLMISQLLAAMVGSASVLRSGEAALMRVAVYGLVLASPFILYVLSRVSVVFPALVAEPLTPFEALRRSRQLTQGQGWRITGLLLAAAMLYLFVQLALGTALGAIFMLLERLTGLQGIGGLLLGVLAGALGAVANLVLTLAVAFLYRDLVE